MRGVIGGCLLCAAASLPLHRAIAQDSQGQAITLQGQAPATCVWSTPQSLSAANMALGSAATQNVLGITNLASATTGQLQAASITVSMRGICNQPHALTISTANGGLKSQNSPTALTTGFASRVDYSAQANWGGITASLQTTGTALAATPVKIQGAYSGSLLLQIVIDTAGAGNLPLVAGAYTDTLTITLSPQL